MPLELKKTQSSDRRNDTCIGCEDMQQGSEDVPGQLG